MPADIWPVGELSEIKSKKHEDVLQLMLPLLSKLSAEKRWITLISPPSEIDKQFFIDHGIDVSHVLLIHPKKNVDDIITMNKALKNGMSGIVILWSSSFKKRFVAQWRKSVKQGFCRGVIINHNGLDHGSKSVALTLNISTVRHTLVITSAKKFDKDFQYQSKALISAEKPCRSNNASISHAQRQLVN